MVAGFAWSGWQPSRGPRGSFHVDWVAAFMWIEWQPSYGLGGRNPWNMQPFGSWRCQQSVSCSDLVSVYGCQLRVAAPNTYGGSIITDVTIAEQRCCDPLRPRNDFVPSYRPSMLPLLSSPRRIFSPLHSLDTVSHRPDRSGGFPWRWDPSVSNDLLSVWALTPITRFSIRLSTRAGRPG